MEINLENMIIIKKEYPAVCFDLTEAFVVNPAFYNAPVKEEKEKDETKVAGNMEEVSE